MLSRSQLNILLNALEEYEKRWLESEEWYVPDFQGVRAALLNDDDTWIPVEADITVDGAGYSPVLAVIRGGREITINTRMIAGDSFFISLSENLRVFQRVKFDEMKWSTR